MFHSAVNSITPENQSEIFFDMYFVNECNKHVFVDAIPSNTYAFVEGLLRLGSDRKCITLSTNYTREQLSEWDASTY